MQFADRLQNVETSAIRELFKLLGKPGIISFAGGFPDPALFDVEGVRMATEAALADNPGAVPVGVVLTTPLTESSYCKELIILAELNPGSLIPHDRVMTALRLLCQEVMPKFK